MKTCSLCKEKINEKEKYVHIEDWENKKMTKEVWCHFKCFVKSMNREKTRLEMKSEMALDKALGMLNQAGSVFNQIAPSKEEYII